MSLQQKNKRQAVVVIHGIGEQRPMDTLRSFVRAVKNELEENSPFKEEEKKSTTRSKPDSIGDIYETVRISMDSTTNRPITDSANIDKTGFDISSQFINGGAAIVLSSFTKIQGAQAGKIVIKLVEFLKQNANREIAFGEVMLKLRQHLLANGIMAGLALVSFGMATGK